MLSIYEGELKLLNGGELRDVSVAASHDHSYHPRLQSLSLVSIARPTLVPLGLHAGPPFQVFSNNLYTQDWFWSALLNNYDPDSEEFHNSYHREWYEHTYSQGSGGLLFKAYSDDVPSNSDRPRITHFLFYAAKMGKSGRESLPSPPPSSPTRQTSHSVNSGHQFSPDEFFVFALPLSTDLLDRVTARYIAPPSPTTLPSEDFSGSSDGKFLPNTINDTSAGTEGKQKRQRMSDLFDKASQRQLKARRTESQDLGTLPKYEPVRSQLGWSFSSSGMAPKFEEHGEPKLNDIPQLKRIASTSSATLANGSGRSNSNSQLKRPSLSRADSISNFPSPTCDEEEGMMVRNKDVISRVVMAALRLNGMQPRNSRAKSRCPYMTDRLEQGEIGHYPAEFAKDTDEESYKAMYHMLLKSTIHTFRTHMKSTQLQNHPEALRDTVEKLLAIFISNPLSEPVQPAFIKSESDGVK